MPIDRDIQRLVRREAAAIKPTLTSDDLFQSSEFKNHLSNIISTATGKYKVPVALKLFHDIGDNTTAHTQGDTITQNTGCRLINDFDSIYNRYMSCVGMTLHEVGHILFCDFDSNKKAHKTMESGTLYGDEPQTTTPEEADALDEMKSALATPEYAPIFQTVYHELMNSIIDPHDEDKMIERFGKFVSEAICMTREALKLGIPSVETMMAKNISKLSIIYALVLQFVRFGEIVADDIEKAYRLEPVQKLMQMSATLEIARYTDDPKVRANAMNELLLFLWPYIKEEIDKQEQKQKQEQQGDGSQQHGSGNGHPQQSQSGDPSQNGQQNTQTQNGNSEQGGQPQTPSAQTIQNVLAQLQQGAQNGGQTQAPQDVKTSKEAKQNTRMAVKGGSPQKSGSGNNAANKDASESGQNVLDSVLSAIAQSQAEENVRQDISAKSSECIIGTNQSSTHKGRTVQVVPNINVDEADKALYNTFMQELEGYSRRLRKQMTEALRDLKDGSIAHHRICGNRFEADSAYRVDQRYYANKKMPQDLPDMAISVLVDHSGSMRGERLVASMKASMLLYDFATKLDIPVCVSGHNTTSSGIRYYTYTDFRKVSDSEKYRLAKMVAGSCNRDGMAIEIAAAQLAKRPEDVKLLIIISDGKPNDSNYGGEEAAKDISSIVKRYHKQGVETIAAAIGTDKDRIREIYGNGSFLDIENLDKLPKTLVGLVKKRII